MGMPKDNGCAACVLVKRKEYYKNDLKQKSPLQYISKSETLSSFYPLDPPYPTADVNRFMSCFSQGIDPMKISKTKYRTDGMFALREKGAGGHDSAPCAGDQTLGS